MAHSALHESSAASVGGGTALGRMVQLASSTLAAPIVHPLANDVRAAPPCARLGPSTLTLSQP